MTQETFLTPLLRSSRMSWQLQNTRNGVTVARQLIPAFDSKTRRTGLLGRASLEDGHAMVIAPSNAIHTFFMRFPIDVAFVARDGRIVKIRAAVPPWRAAAALRGFAVIELAAGALARADTREGDTVAVVVAS